MHLTVASVVLVVLAACVSTTHTRSLVRVQAAEQHGQACFKCVHRAYFHRLSRFPGPKAAALTSWYITYYVYCGNVHLKLEKWHQRYGTVHYGAQ